MSKRDTWGIFPPHSLARIFAVGSALFVALALGIVLLMVMSGCDHRPVRPDRPKPTVHTTPTLPSTVKFADQSAPAN